MDVRLSVCRPGWDKVSATPVEDRSMSLGTPATCIYKFAWDQCGQSGYLATVFALLRGRASETAQGSILPPKWIPKRP